VSLRGSPAARILSVAAVFMIVFGACSSSGATTAPASSSAPTPAGPAGSLAPTVAPSSSDAVVSLAPCGSVNLAVNPWVGYEADAAVVAYIAEHSLGCTVVKKNLDEQTSWQGFETGVVDAILENWGHEDLAAKYITTQKVAEDAGMTGNEGVIGWYVPKFFADANPDILTAATNPTILNKYADQFKTSESGDKGQILDGDPSFVTNDQAIIDGLGLNFKVVYSGSEAASDKAIQTAIDQQKPILAYYYEPNWFSAVVQVTHVALPAWTQGCDTADPKKIACDYPPYHLNKIVSTKLATSGSPFYTLVKNFNWTNDDQNAVAASISQDGLSDEDAAKKWLDANPAKWQAWLPAS
jgi:glycine betaine/proline transport system substrate-binding protein